MVNFFRVLRDPVQCARLTELCYLTPFAREEFDLAYELTDDPVEQARRLTVRASMGFGSAGATKGATGFRVDTRRSYGTAQHIWAKYPAILSQIGQRMQGVLIENRPAMDVAAQHDGVDTLHYFDPPYVMETRDPRASSPGSKYYRHEMTDEMHGAFLTDAQKLEGMVVISGYDCPLYEAHLGAWEKHQTSSRISAGRGAGVREETLWINPACSAALKRPRQQADMLEDCNAICDD